MGAVDVSDDEPPVANVSRRHDEIVAIAIVGGDQHLVGDLVRDVEPR
jgi:hypothetical protein